MHAMHPIKDKRARLRVAARYIKNGVVRFPRTGCEQLITQQLGFGLRSMTMPATPWSISFSD
jgi:2-keto-3-deoxy-L-rhamnonate aldolase RhmA